MAWQEPTYRCVGWLYVLCGNVASTSGTASIAGKGYTPVLVEAVFGWTVLEGAVLGEAVLGNSVPAPRFFSAVSSASALATCLAPEEGLTGFGSGLFLVSFLPRA